MAKIYERLLSTNILRGKKAALVLSFTCKSVGQGKYLYG